MTKNRCKICDLLGDNRGHQFCQLEALHQLGQSAGGPANLASYMSTSLYLQQLKDMMLAAYLLKGYYQPAGPLIQHPPTLPPVKGPPPEPTPTPPQNSEGSDDLVATSTTSGGTSSTGGGFYRTYCPQYYATPPQYQDLCYPPSYSHSHPHPPPYYHKYAPPYRRQYYGYQESGAGGGPGGSGAGPGVVEYQPPPGEYLPPYYGGYPPPPPPPPPPPNPAYLHSQGRPFVDHAFQSCPCPMQSCPKNADTGPLIGNGKGAPVVSGPGLSLPPSALVGPPSPARGLAGLAPPHGANAWDTDRVQLNPAHRSHNQSQSQSQSQQQQQQQQLKQLQPAAASQQQQAGHTSRANIDCIAKGENDCTEGKLCLSSSSSSSSGNGSSSKCACSQKRAAVCSSSCEVKLEQSVSPASDAAGGSSSPSSPSESRPHLTNGHHDKLLHPHHHHHHNHNHPHHHPHHHSLKLENNNVKCESCSGDLQHQHRHLPIEEAAVVAASATVDEEQSRGEQSQSQSQQQQQQQQQHVPTAQSCRVKCEAGYKCEIMKCEQCAKEAGQLAIMEMDKDSGILEDDAGSGKLETDTEVKEELNALAEAVEWKKPDYEPTAAEPLAEDDGEEVDDDDEEDDEDEVDEENELAYKGLNVNVDESLEVQQQRQHQQHQPKCQKLSKRKLSLDSLSDFSKLKKVNKRTLSVGSPREFVGAQQLPASSVPTINGTNERLEEARNDTEDVVDTSETVKETPNPPKKKPTKKEAQSQKRKSDAPSSSETPPKKSKSTATKTVASETSIMETINNVIQQSLQMSQKPAKTKKTKCWGGNKVEKKNKKNSVNLLSTIKRASKKLDLVKAVVTEKLGLIRNEIKNSQQKINNKVDAKLKSKVQNVKTKNSKVKAKLLEVKSKVLETKNNNNNKLPEVKNNKISETKSKAAEAKNKVAEAKSKVAEAKAKVAEAKAKVAETKSKAAEAKCKVVETKSKVVETKSNSKVVETKNNNKVAEAKCNSKVVEVKASKVAEAKSDNKQVEVKSSSKIPESKASGKVTETKHSRGRSQEAKELKETKDTKESKETKDAKTSVTPTTPISAKEAKLGKLKDCAKKGRPLEVPTLEAKKNGKKKGKGAKKWSGRRESFCKVEEQNREPVGRCLPMPRRPFLKPKWSNGWSWEGDAFEAKVYLTNEESAIRRCYVSMRHESGDVLRPLDCVLLKSGPRKADLPFVAKIAALWENPDDGEMMFSLLWYYRPEHTEQGRTEYDTDDEVFASRHRDANSVACIEDKCYILTFNEYCRYRKNLRRIEEGLDYPGLIVPPGDQLYPRDGRQPPIPVPQDMVLFCRRVYDYRGKKLVKNPG